MHAARCGHRDPDKTRKDWRSQPEASGKINSTLLIGAAMAEGTAIFGFVTALIIIFAA